MQLAASFQSNAFSHLRELDLSGNNIQTAEMENLLMALQGQHCAQALKVRINTSQTPCSFWCILADSMEAEGRSVY